MEENLETFQTFRNTEVANEFAEILKQQNIPYSLEENRPFYDPAMSNAAEPDISIRIKPEDFPKASRALEAYYKSQLDDVDKDYYLFDFSDDELVEILSKPDEWGPFDYQLAQKLLAERGKEIKPEVADLLKVNRNKELARPESVSRYLIYSGYASAIAGGLFGFFIGWSLAYHKKTLPDGTQIYAYKDDVRNHGTRILLISCIGIVLLVLTTLRLID